MDSNFQAWYLVVALAFSGLGSAMITEAFRRMIERAGTKRDFIECLVTFVVFGLSGLTTMAAALAGIYRLISK